MLMNDTPPDSETTRRIAPASTATSRPYRTASHGGRCAHGRDGHGRFPGRLCHPPALDIILNPQSTVAELELFRIPAPTRGLSEFVCSLTHSSRLVGFCARAAVPVSCSRASPNISAAPIQYVGLASITDLRNQIYSKIGSAADRILPAQSRDGDVRGGQRYRADARSLLRTGWRRFSASFSRFSLFPVVLASSTGGWPWARRF